jgi:hypothetical protein
MNKQDHAAALILGLAAADTEDARLHLLDTDVREFAESDGPTMVLGAAALVGALVQDLADCRGTSLEEAFAAIGTIIAQRRADQ